MFEGLSRSAFEGTGFSVPKVLGVVLLGNLLAVFPWVALITRMVRDSRLSGAGVARSVSLRCLTGLRRGFACLLAFHTPLACSGSVRLCAAAGGVVLFLCVH